MPRRLGASARSPLRQETGAHAAHHRRPVARAKISLSAARYPADARSRARDAVQLAAAPRIDGARCLDLYRRFGRARAGGAVARCRRGGLRRAADAPRRRDRAAARGLAGRRAAACSATRRGITLRASPLGGERFDLVFLDPPYRFRERWRPGAASARAAGWLAADARIYVEHARPIEPLPALPAAWRELRSGNRRRGQVSSARARNAGRERRYTHENQSACIQGRSIRSRAGTRTSCAARRSIFEQVRDRDRRQSRTRRRCSTSSSAVELARAVLADLPNVEVDRLLGADGGVCARARPVGDRARPARGVGFRVRISAREHGPASAARRSRPCSWCRRRSSPSSPRPWCARSQSWAVMSAPSCIRWSRRRSRAARGQVSACVDL